MPFMMPFFGQQQAAPQQSPESFVPQDYLAALSGMGLSMGPMQFDPMGRYGITDQQQRYAQNQSLSSVLGGVAQTFIDPLGSPMAAMQAGLGAGQVQSQLLDKASQQNLIAQNAKMDNALNQLKMFSTMSQIEQGEVALEGAKLELDNKKQAVNATYEVAKSYGGVVDGIAKQMELDGKKESADAVRATGLAMLAEIKSGRVAEAMQTFEAKIAPYMEAYPDLAKGLIVAETNKSIQRIGALPEVLEAMKKVAPMIGADIDFDKNGNPVLVSGFEQKVRDLEIRAKEAQIAESASRVRANNALAGLRETGETGGGIKLETAGRTLLENLDGAAATLKKYGSSPATIKQAIEDLPSNQRAAALKEVNAAILAFSKIGINLDRGPVKSGKYVTAGTPLDRWLSLTPEMKMMAVREYLESRKEGL